MKIQCACGAKYAFDITPDMADKPIRFVCQHCGLDSSDFVNRLIRQELGLVTATTLPTPAPPPPPLAPAIPVAVARPRLQVAQVAAPASSAGQTVTPGDANLPVCLKHHGEPCTERCVVCQKPMCPKCMELFGYVCSPLCKAKAEAQKIHVPVYALQKSVVEAQFWRKVYAISGAIGGVLLALLGFWTWYAWIGSLPRPFLSVRFDERAYAGASQLCGQDQIVFLHGATLARYDLKSKKQIWSRQLFDRQQIADQVAKEEAAWQAEEARMRGQTPSTTLPVPDDKDIQSALGAAEEELQLFAVDSNVWVRGTERLTHYDWDSGKVLQEIPLTGGYEDITPRGGELIMRGMNEAGQELVTSVNLASGESHTEEVGRPVTPALAPGGLLGAMALASAKNNSSGAGLPLSPGANMNKPLDPGKVAEQAQRLPLPARIALPALVASSIHQERILREADDGDTDAPGKPPQAIARTARATNDLAHAENVSLVSSEYGYVRMGVRLLEHREVTRDAMKAPPKKSIIDSGNLSAANTGDAANELLNQMQREHGSTTVTEDESLYQVSLGRPDSTEAADWTGQVVGPPAVFPLKTVNVLVAGKTVIVFDKSNKKLWQATLAFSLAGGGQVDFFGRESSRFGEGPCVERGDTLYIFDQAVLTAFDLATGNARWRLPSVGVMGLFFDDRGMLYANSTTASPESIKYSRQIDINQKTEDVLIKVDPKTGKTLWSVKPGGFISYLSGKYIFALFVNDPGDEPDAGAALAGITPTPAFVHIRRINPRNGEVMWDYYQDRAPLDVKFNGNMIQMVFKKEVQVLKFMSL